MISQSAMLSSLPIGAALLDKDFATLEINRALANFFPDTPAHENDALISIFDEASQESLLSQFKTQNEQAVLPMMQLGNTEVWVDVTLVPAPDTTAARYVAYFENATALKLANNLIDAVSAHIGNASGESFFTDISLYLAQKLDYQYAFIGQLIGVNTVQILGGAVGDQPMETFEYNLAGAPCENVVGRETCVYTSNVAKLFPNDHHLEQMGAVSYIGSPLFDANGNAIGLIAMIGTKPIKNESLARSTITALSNRVSAEIERERVTKQLQYQATHDLLCDIHNRYAFEEEIERLIVNSRRTKLEHIVFYMDLDQFKVVNDTCGHAAGDALLKQVSLLLQAELGDSCVLARLGGDEFGLIKTQCSVDSGRQLAQSVLDLLAEFQFVWEDSVFRPNISIGIVNINKDTLSVADIIKHADTACYLAKENGRHRYHVYLPDDEQTSTHENELLWVSELHQSIANDDFTLFAQAIAPTKKVDEGHLHFELLIRKLDEAGNIIPPNTFLPAAERYNVISRLDEWVIKRCFKYLSENTDFIKYIDFVSVNLSGQSLTSESVLNLIQNELLRTGVPADKLCFEITETTAISKLSEAKEFIDKLKKVGCRFALDDFGSGLSSFGYLKYLPVDYLKIDGMFVKDILNDPVDHVMVKSINEMGHALGMQTIAEFVENDTIKAVIKSIGVDFVQGYGIGKPMPFEDVIALHR